MPDGDIWAVHGLCGGCAAAGQCRFGVRKYIDADRVARGEVTFDTLATGGPGVVHGGYAALVFDEITGMVPVAHEFGPSVTKSLAVTYRKPIPVQQSIILSARLDRAEGRDLHISAEMRLAAGDALLASAEAIFRQVPASHFSRHAEWLSQQPGLSCG
jgi:acyl-coenzyme A thioesterase PaaI-like protein